MALPAGDPRTPVQPPGRRPQSLLFACSHNAVRSPMAEALARRLFGRDVYFASAGVRAGQLDPFAVAAMAEIGVDIASYKPKAFGDLDDMNFDMIVSLSPEAHHSALEFTRALALEAVYWPTLDATAVRGSREQMLDAYRTVRDGLERRIKELLSVETTAKRRDA
jgi:protein-tyrosine-phosphatase